MPFYDYQCEDCKNIQEESHPMTGPIENITCCKIGVKFHGYEMFQIAPEAKAKLQQFILRSFVKTISPKLNN
jgi:hypothetical protein